MSEKERSSEINQSTYIKEIKKVPSLKKLKDRFRRRALLQNILILLLAALSAYLCYSLYLNQKDHINKVFITVMTGIVVLYNILMSYFFIFIKKEEVSNIHEDSIGKFSKRELLQIINEVISPVKDDGGEVPAFYIHNNKYLNMFTVDILLFDFIKPLNAVYISENSLNNLNRDELKSVLAHEIGHFRYYMDPLSRAYYLFILTVALLSAAITAALHIDKFWYSFIFYIIVFKIVKFILNIPFCSSMKDCEYLSDHYAAEQCGVLNIINGLLMTGKHIEMMVYIQRAVSLRVIKSRKYSYHHTLEIIRKIEESLKNRIMTRKELDHVIETIFKSPEVKSLKEDLADDEIEDRNIKLKKNIKELMGKHNIKRINWTSFDFHVKDHRVDEVEYPFLIKTLMENPRSQLLSYKFDNVIENKFGSHPTMRERILFLHKNICKPPGEV